MAYSKIIQIATTSGGTYTELPEPSSISYQFNDVDKDAYTNLTGKTIRNRVRSNVTLLKIAYGAISEDTANTIFTLINPVWFYVKFINPITKTEVIKKMYCSPKDITLLFHKNTEGSSTTMYEGLTFEFVEE